MAVIRTLYPDLEQLVEDLVFLDELENSNNVPEDERMNVTIFVCPKIPNETQKYIWRTII